MVRTKEGGLGPAPKPHLREDTRWDFHGYLSGRAHQAVLDLQYQRRKAVPPIEQSVHDIVDEAILRAAGEGLGPDEYNALNAAQAQLARCGVEAKRVEILRRLIWYYLDHLVARAEGGEPVFSNQQKEA